MKHYHCRDIDVTQLSTSERHRLIKQPNERILLTFDDGETVECYFRAYLLSAYNWVLYLRHGEHMKLTKAHLIGYPLKRSSVNNLWNYILADIREKRNNKIVSFDYQYIAQEYLICYNRMYNDFSTTLTAYVDGANMKDLRELVHHPVMEEMYQNIQPSHHSQRKSYETTSTFVKTHPDMLNNQFAKAVRRGLVDEKQFLTTVVGRFYVNEINGHQFPTPVLSGYARGIHDVLWTAQESRDASVAELQSKTPVQKSDYLNRRLQSISAIIRNIKSDDCGTKETIPWYVTKRDLEPLVGMYRVDEMGQVIRINTGDKYLIGTTIHLHSAPTCHHLHEYGVCRKCLGDVSTQLPSTFSVGHLSIIGALGAFVQLSLSAKHLIVSREAVTFDLDADAALFFKFPRKDDHNSLVIRPEVVNKGATVEFIFKVNQLKFLADIADGISVEDLQLSTASFVDTMQVALTTKSGSKRVTPVTISDIGRKAQFTREFMDYVINSQDMVSLVRTNVKIDLEKWDKRLPIFNIPMKLAGVSDFMSKFETTIINGSVKYGLDASKSSGISDMMRYCYDIVRECVHIPVSHLGVMIASFLIRDKQALDYRLPLPGGPREFDTMANIYAYRSIAQMMSYEKRLVYMKSPTITLVGTRPNHPMDALYFPEKMDIYADVRRAYQEGTIDPIALPDRAKVFKDSSGS